MFFIIANNFRSIGAVHTSHALVGYYDGGQYIFFDPNGSREELASGGRDSVYTTPAFLRFPRKFFNSLYNVINVQFGIPNTKKWFYVGDPVSCPIEKRTCAYRSMMFMVGLDAYNGDPVKAVQYATGMVGDKKSLALIKRLAKSAYNGKDDTEILTLMATMNIDKSTHDIKFVNPNIYITI